MRRVPFVKVRRFSRIFSVPTSALSFFLFSFSLSLSLSRSLSLSHSLSHSLSLSLCLSLSLFFVRSCSQSRDTLSSLIASLYCKKCARRSPPCQQLRIEETEAVSLESARAATGSRLQACTHGDRLSLLLWLRRMKHAGPASIVT